MRVGVSQRDLDLPDFALGRVELGEDAVEGFDRLGLGERQVRLVTSRYQRKILRRIRQR